MIGIWFSICLGVIFLEFFFICRIRRQLVAWLDYLKAVKDSPEQKLFVKGKGILAEISFELNGVLETNRRQVLELKRAEEANQQILTNLSHDVRTPLASLTGYLEALEQGKRTAQEEYIHVAYRKALELKELVDTLFEWFQIQAKEQQYQKEWYDINELTREIVIEFLPFIEKNRIFLEAAFSEEEWFFWMDRVAYKRMLRNLIYNAIQHGTCDLIRIEIQKKEETILISVFNNGKGIPKEQMEFLFDRFYRGDLERGNGGTGLGLSIVKELAAAMDGIVSAKSLEGYGTTFYLEFPIRNVREK